MRVTHLKLTNVRAIQTAEFDFRPGFNLIIGVNGVGKTTVLDALGVCLSSVIRDSYDLNTEYKGFRASDVHVGVDTLNMVCKVWYGTSEYPTYVKVVPHPTQDWDSRRNPSIQRITGKGIDPDEEADPGGLPLAVFFSTRRAYASNRAVAKGEAAGGARSAVARAFANRELNVREFAEWMHAQQEASSERPPVRCVLQELERTVSAILPGYCNLRAKGTKRVELLIDHEGVELSVSQLSDGERSLLSMVVDLTRRLVQANPLMENPTAEAEAVVLIDELELHLHPKWQRQIVAKLTKAFPKCQFIATTHSPQIIGELEPERIHIISDSGVCSPSLSYGVDSSRVLQEIMDTDSRIGDMENLLAQVSRQIDEDDLEQARNSLLSIEKILGENDADVVRLKTLISFLEGDE